MNAKASLKSLSPKSARTLVAGAVVVVLVAFLGGILIGTGGRMNQGVGIAFYVLVALITGITFWTLTPSADSVAHATFSNWGFKLGGGAAIGLVFAWAAWKQVPPDGGYRVVKLPDEVPDAAIDARALSSIRDVEIIAQRRVLVEFEAGARSGTVELAWLSHEAAEDVGFRVVKRYVLDRFGTLKEVERD